MIQARAGGLLAPRLRPVVPLTGVRPRGAACSSLTMKRKARVSVLVLAAAALIACSKTPAAPGILESSDLVAATSASFSADEIVNLASFTDDATITSAQIQSFFESTPYGTASFLSTYSSNGVRAADAIIAAAQQYAVNPLVFLVRAEMDGGLIGLQVYPATPNRVEYVFGCGCPDTQTSCDPSSAGFNVQSACLGYALRESLTSIASSGHTDGGWAPKVATVTLDSVLVTPADPSTAALYQYTPRVEVGAAGGNWLFWNLWEKYAAAFKYKGASTTSPTAAIGDACTVSGSCAYQGGICATNYPGGLCTATCTTTCPTDSSSTASFCADFAGQGGFCLPVCNPNASACRSGYSCTRVAEFGDAGAGQYVCAPAS